MALRWNYMAAATVMVAGLLILGGAPVTPVVAGVALVWIVNLLRVKSRRA